MDEAQLEGFVRVTFWKLTITALLTVTVTFEVFVKLRCIQKLFLAGELAEMEAELEADMVAEDIMVTEQMQQQATT